MAATDKAPPVKDRKRVFTPEQLARRKETEKAYHAANREARNARCRAYNKTHPEKPRTRSAQFKERKNAKARAKYAAHPENRRVYTEEQKRLRNIVNADYRKTHAVDLAAKARSRNAKNSEQRKAYSAKWASDHKEQKRASSKAWRLANPEKVRASSLRLHADRIKQQVVYRATHRDESRLKSAAWRKANPERQKAALKKWQAENPEKVRALRVKRRLIKRNATIGNTRVIAAWEKKWKARRTIICYWHRGEVSTKECHSDHIIPIAKGGAHTIENLCVSCAKCNKTKNAKTIEVWNRQLVEPVLF